MHSIDFNSLVSLISTNKNEKTMLTFHSIGDMDSVASATVLSKAFNDSIVSSPDRITANSRSMLEKMGYKDDTISKVFVDDAKLVVMLDVNNFYDCGSFQEKLEQFKNTIIIIDHHANTNIKKDNVYVFNDEKYNSASSIVFDLINSLDIKINPNDAILLAAGIISDSAEMQNSSAHTFTQLGRIFEASKQNYNSILGYMEHIPSPQARADTINDLAEASVSIQNNILFMFGKAHGHANVAADDSIKIGADISLFYSDIGGGISISVRMRQGLENELNLHLGVIMKSIAAIIDGTGGGHPCAAGAYGKNPGGIGKFLSEFNKIIFKN
jgi:nanoRNase/pAp phosphatase (c-di-AMP/oligoRNAs hydrolase)